MRKALHSSTAASSSIGVSDADIRGNSGMRIFLVATLLVPLGCATNNEAVEVGPNIYKVSSVASPAQGGVAGARQRAMDSANKKCESLGRSITVSSVDEFPTAGRAVVTFTCK
jgi:hypothetical protein